MSHGARAGPMQAYEGVGKDVSPGRLRGQAFCRPRRVRERDVTSYDELSPFFAFDFFLKVCKREN